MYQNKYVKKIIASITIKMVNEFDI